MQHIHFHTVTVQRHHRRKAGSFAQVFTLFASLPGHSLSRLRFVGDFPQSRPLLPIYCPIYYLVIIVTQPSVTDSTVRQATSKEI